MPGVATGRRRCATTARYLREHPEATLEEAAAFVNGLIGKSAWLSPAIWIICAQAAA
ncbi:MAG: hypothetical protein ACLUI3_14535 [Christensenellales bacterium]